jgi:hypothetical protein
MRRVSGTALLKAGFPDMDNEPHDTPFEVKARDGDIAITGPNGLHTSLTVQAAVASARRLLDAAGALRETETYQKPLG